MSGETQVSTVLEALAARSGCGADLDSSIKWRSSGDPRLQCTAKRETSLFTALLLGLKAAATELEHPV